MLNTKTQGNSTFGSGEDDLDVFWPTTDLADIYVMWPRPHIKFYIASSIVGNPNRKKMHIFDFVGIFEYIC